MTICCSTKEDEGHEMMLGSSESSRRNIHPVEVTSVSLKDETEQLWPKFFRECSCLAQKYIVTTGQHTETCKYMFPTYQCIEQSSTRITLWIPSRGFTRRKKKESAMQTYKISLTNKCGGIGEDWMLHLRMSSHLFPIITPYSSYELAISFSIFCRFFPFLFIHRLLAWRCLGFFFLYPFIIRVFKN